MTRQIASTCMLRRRQQLFVDVCDWHVARTYVSSVRSTPTRSTPMFLVLQNVGDDGGDGHCDIAVSLDAHSRLHVRNEERGRQTIRQERMERANHEKVRMLMKCREPWHETN